MGTFAIVAITMAVLAAGLLLLLLLLKRGDGVPRHLNFRVAVRRPDLWWKMITAYFQRREAISSKVLNNAEIRRCIKHLLNSRKEEDARMLLEAQGERATPFLLEVLDDSRYRRSIPGKGIWNVVHFTSLEPVLRLLEPFAPPETIPHLAPLVDDPDPEVRKWAGGFLAGLVRPECIDPVLKALGDPHDFVRSWILMKIRKAIEEKRATQ